MLKPANYDVLGFDSSLLTQARHAWGLDFEDRIHPLLIEQDSAVALEARSQTARKAILMARGRQYFLKQAPWYASAPRQVETICAIQTRAAAHGLAPDLISCRNGEHAAWIGAQPFYLMPMVQAARYNKTPQQDLSAARTLADFHNLPADLSSAPNRNYFDLVEEFLELSCSKAGPELAGAMEAALTCARRSSGQLQAPPATLVHGDASPWNFLFHSGRADLVDFDNCDVGMPQRDVAEAVLTFCGLSYAGDSTTFAEPFQFELDRDRARSFLRSYFKVVKKPWAPDALALLDPVFKALATEYVALGLLRGELKAERDRKAASSFLSLPISIAQLAQEAA